MKRRQLNISTRTMTEAVKNKEVLDALALAVLCKMLFVSSTIKDAKITRVMELFGIGYARCKRTINVGLEKGFFRMSEDGKDLIANSLKEYGAYNFLFALPKLSASRLLKRGKALKAHYTLTQICNFIREAVIINHISKQQNLFYTLSKTQNPKDLAEYRKAKSILRKYSMRHGVVERKGRMISYNRMADTISCSRSTAKRLVKGLVARKTLSMQLNYEESGFNYEQFGKKLQYEYNEYSKRNFLITMDGKVLFQLSNSYTVIRTDIIRFLRQPKQTA